MFISPNTFIPLPGPVIPIGINPGSDNTGIVPPWLRRDLGHEATTPTIHPNWRADFSK